MRVVLDSNVLFSALISPHSPPHALLEAWREGRRSFANAQLRSHAYRQAGGVLQGIPEALNCLRA